MRWLFIGKTKAMQQLLHACRRILYIIRLLDVETNLFARAISIFVDMFRKFLLLFFRQRTSLAGIAQSEKFIFAAVLVFLKPMIDGRFINEQDFSSFRNRPTIAEEDNGFNAVGKSAISKCTVKRLECGNFYWAQLKVVHRGDIYLVLSNFYLVLSE